MWFTLFVIDKEMQDAQIHATQTESLPAEPFGHSGNVAKNAS